MKTLTPNQYAEIVWGGVVTGKTVRSWINSGKELKGVDKVETTPTGHYVLFMKEPGATKTKAQKLAEMLQAKAA